MRTLWAKDRLIKNDELCFAFKIKKSDDVKMHLVGRDVFNVYVNGEFVLYGPARAAHDYLRVEKLDITKYLTQEENVIVIDVVSNFVPMLSHACEPPIVGADIFVNGEKAFDIFDFTCHEMTDRIIKVERFSDMRGFIEYYKMDFDRTRFYKGELDLFPTLEIEEKECPTLIDKGVSDFIYEVRTPELYDEYNVKYVDNPEWTGDFPDLLNDATIMQSYSRKDCDRVATYKFNDFENTKTEIGDAKGYTYDFGRNITGRMKFEVEVKEETTLHLLYDEVLIDNDVMYNRQFIVHGLVWELKPGKYTLWSFETYTYRYMKFVIEGSAEVKNIQSFSIENPNTGDFTCQCADKNVKIIIDAAKHTIEQNASDTLTDCPSRERAAWLCDSFFSSQAERLFTGKNLCERNHLENYCLYHGMAKMREHVVPQCYPSQSKSGSFIPNWMCWLVFEIANYAKNTGDMELVERAKVRVEDVVKFFSQYENELGLLEDLPGWVFVEWSKANDYVKAVNFPSNMLYGATLEVAGEMLSRPELIEKGKKIKALVEKMSFNGEFFCDDAVRVDGKLVPQFDHTTETCQYYAIFFGIATKDKYQKLITTMVDNFGMYRDDEVVYPNVPRANMFIGNFLRLEILRRECAYEKLIEECKSFLLIPAKTNSCLWENRIERDDLKYRIKGSCCHGFAAIAGCFLTEALTGFRGFSSSEKEIYVTGKNVAIDAEFTLPIDDKVMKVTNKDGKVTFEVPEGYKIIGI